MQAKKTLFSKFTRVPNRGLALLFPLALFPAWALTLSVCFAAPRCAAAQSSDLTVAASSSSFNSGPEIEELPDAPAPAAVESLHLKSSGQTSRVGVRTHRTTRHDRLIDPTEIAPKVNNLDKVVMGFEGAVSPYSIVGWLGISAYEQAFNRSPNYGQTGKGFAQRLGAAAARGGSDGIFTHALYSPIFHSDPRYYVLGPGHGFARRAGYAISRVLITKKDDGGETVNFALLAGNLTGAAVTQTYYPPGNRNLGQVLSTFGSSLAGSAFGYLFDEFVVNSAEFLQLKRKL